MRAASLLLLLSLPLAACMQTGEQTPAPTGAAAPASPADAPAAPPAAPQRSVAASPSPTRGAGPSGGARGGAATAAARVEPVEVLPDALQQARVDCWMKVESQKGLRNIDQRGTFVEKCVADQLKGKPSP